MTYTKKTAMVSRDGYGVSQSATGAIVGGVSALMVHVASVSDECKRRLSAMVEAKIELDKLDISLPPYDERTSTQNKMVSELRSRKDFYTCVAVWEVMKVVEKSPKDFPGFNSEELNKLITSKISRGVICSRVCERLALAKSPFVF